MRDNAKEPAGPGLLPRAAAWLLLAVSLLAAVEAFGLLRRNWLLLWPGLLLAGGLAGALWIGQQARRRGLGLRVALADAGLRPVVGPAALALAGGLGETLRAAGALPGPASFVWPLGLGAWGVLLLADAAAPQWARQAGALVLLAGLLRAFEALFGIQPGAVGTGWFVALGAAALQALRRPAPGSADAAAGDRGTEGQAGRGSDAAR